MEPTLRIYACGGCGANLIQQKIEIPVAPGYPSVKSVMIDTSTANYVPGAGVEFYQIPGVTGMGRNRGATLDIGMDKIEPILKDHKPGTMNVILASGGGGTGSVISLLLLRELLKRKIPVVLMLVCSSASGVDTDNSYKTLLSLQKAVQGIGRPVPFMYYENMSKPTGRVGDGPRDMVDDVIVNDIRALALTVSEQHRELDRQDVENWLNYPVVTNIPAQLVEVKLVTGDANEQKEFFANRVIGTISLLTDTAKLSPEFNQPYEKTGYYSEQLAADATDLTWVLSAANVVGYGKELQKASERYQATATEIAAVQGLSLEGLDDSDDLVI